MNTTSSVPILNPSPETGFNLTYYLGTTNWRGLGLGSYKLCSHPLHSFTLSAPAVMQNQGHPSSAGIQRHLRSIRPTWRSLKSAYTEKQLCYIQQACFIMQLSLLFLYRGTQSEDRERIFQCSVKTNLRRVTAYTGISYNIE
jgi:hypothetical protein